MAALDLRVWIQAPHWAQNSLKKRKQIKKEGRKEEIKEIASPLKEISYTKIQTHKFMKEF